MSESDRPERSCFSFTEIYFGAKVIGALISVGLSVIIYSEIFRSKDKPKPVWLDALEAVYVAGGLAAVKVVTWAFDTGPSQTAQVDQPTPTYAIVNHEAIVKANNTKAYLIDVRPAPDLQAGDKVIVLGQKEYRDKDGRGEFCLIRDDRAGQKNYYITPISSFTEPDTCRTEPGSGGAEKSSSGLPSTAPR